MYKGFLYLLVAITFILPDTCFSQEITDPCVKEGYNRGMQSFNGSDYEKAIYWFKKAAGCPAAKPGEKSIVNEKIDLSYRKILEMDLESASEAYNRTEYDQAIEYYKKAKSNPQSSSLLKDSADRRITQSLLNKFLLAASREKREGNYLAAIRRYTSALYFSVLDDETKQINLDIAECEMRIDLEKANNALNAKDYQTALQYYLDIKASLAYDRVDQGYIESKMDICKDAINKPPDIEMVYVQGGTFQMGSNEGESNEEPVHKVTVSSFYIGKYEVTQKQWKDVMKFNPSSFSGCDSCPVESVSWNDVQEFIRKLNEKSGKNYKLPTEAEWEFAARGGNKSRRYAYAGSNNTGDVAWYYGNSNSKTHPVRLKAPNELGICDMSGNVWEWCADWYADDYYNNSPLNKPENKVQGSAHVCRGGSWLDEPAACRVASRNRFSPDSQRSFVGFRLFRME